MRVTINFPDELVHRLDDHIKNTFRNTKLRSYVVTSAVEQYLAKASKLSARDRVTDSTEISGNKKPVSWGRPFSVPLFQDESSSIVEHHYLELSEANDMRRDTALIFNTVLELSGGYDDISPGMIAAITKCSPEHVGAVLNHLGIERKKKASPSHPMAHFIVWDNGLMEDLFRQYGHEKYQVLFPDIKPYYKNPVGEF